VTLDKEVYFLDEGDLIIFEEQLGIINRIWETEAGTKWELKLMSPDRKIWCNQIEKIELIVPVG